MDRARAKPPNPAQNSTTSQTSHRQQDAHHRSVRALTDTIHTNSRRFPDKPKDLIKHEQKNYLHRKTKYKSDQNAKNNAQKHQTKLILYSNHIKPTPPSGKRTSSNKYKPETAQDTHAKLLLQ